LPYQCHGKIKTKTEMYKSGAKERAATGGWLGNSRKMVGKWGKIGKS